MQVLAPLAGRVIALEDVPDPVFAQGIVGPGLAVAPQDGEVTACAPVAGKILKLHPHAFIILAEGGRGVLVHLGIDTVELAGEGFTLHIAEGERVEAGAAMITFDPAVVERGGRSPVCPVIALEAKPDQIAPAGATAVASGDALFEWA